MLREPHKLEVLESTISSAGGLLLWHPPQFCTLHISWDSGIRVCVCEGRGEGGGLLGGYWRCWGVFPTYSCIRDGDGALDVGDRCSTRLLAELDWQNHGRQVDREEIRNNCLCCRRLMFSGEGSFFSRV